MTAPLPTIFALSSGRPPAAIAVMRVSGPAARDTLAALAGRVPEPRSATLATLRDADGLPLDRALLLWFPGPASATGEDLAELHLHGGRAVVAAVEAALAALPGLVPARPGEFTRRAFENGRIDLLQAEALADLLEAETELQRRHALAVAEGGVSRELDRLREAMLSLSARAEALIEFGDEEDDVTADSGLAADILRLTDRLDGHLRQPVAERLREGVRVVVGGPPNAGKSSLVNALARRDAALVSPEAGTTRDVIEVPLVLDGVPVLLIDGAGLRDTTDGVERLGVERARRALVAADIVLWLGNIDEAPAMENVILVAAKSDLSRPVNSGMPVSAVTGSGLGALVAEIVERAGAMMPRPGSPAASMWARSGLLAAVGHLRAAYTHDADVVLVGEELRLARGELDAITGRAATDEMLDALFGRFCIGK